MTQLLPSPEHYLHNLITMNSSMSKKLWRRALKEHFDCTCVYCGKSYELSQLTLDHVIPRSAGGETIVSNIVPACEKCNQKKASKEWRSFMRAAFGHQKLREHIICKHTNEKAKEV
jgi:5-methylcytosine-specific restriction endonuclease McrA